MKTKTELSIIIPTLNEESNLRKLLASIASQKDVTVEVIIADSGSTDKTITVAANSGLRTSTLNSERGRAAQLNAGASVAGGEFILFLHADSELKDRLALRTALNALRTASAEHSGKLYAGHFAIRFGSESVSSSPEYRLLECKARLNRKGCSHGDQGILIPAELFRNYGGFDLSSPVLAETRFADRLLENEQWLLLPVDLTTSPRRFETEGLKERQSLNAVIMALGEAGHDDLIDFSAVYASHDKSAKLQLKPVLRKIDQEIMALGKTERREFWLKTGGYICENAWQLMFRADLLLLDKGGHALNKGGYRLLGLYDRYLKRLINNRIAIRLTAYAAHLWLKYMARC